VLVGVLLMVGVGTVGWTFRAMFFTLRSSAIEDRTIWASDVVSFRPGRPAATKSTRPAAALGSPDCKREQKDEQSYVALGSGGELILEFNEPFCDGQGPDLVVVEIGPLAEPCDVAVSPDGQTWTSVGRAHGAQSLLDIAPFVPPTGRFRYLRLIDAKRPGDPKNAWPGADIDAVGAYHVAGK
jgi:hypothetical protein